MGTLTLTIVVLIAVLAGFVVGFVLAAIMADSKRADNCARCLTQGRIHKEGTA